MDEPVFVVGIPRSGTTLLAAMLGAHSRLDCGPESRFFARLRHLDRAAREGLLDRAAWPEPAVAFLCSLDNQGVPVHRLFGLAPDDLRTWLAERPPSLAAMLEALTAQRAEREGKPRWVEKTPRHLTLLPLIRSTYPEAAIVRIVRDPRDVALSLARMPFASGSPVANLLQIDRYDRASRDLIRGDRRALTIRYEDLVSDPEGQLRGVCAFVGEAYEAGMLEARSGDGVAAPHEWWKADAAEALDPSRVGRWRAEMPDGVQRFAALHLAGFLDEHGYEGARGAAREVALVPLGDHVPVKAEPMLLALAAADIAVRRTSPAQPADLGRLADVIFLGARGQLASNGARPVGRRIADLMRLGRFLVARRVRGRPVPWVRVATDRARRRWHPDEVIVFALVRLLARRARPAAVVGLLGRRPGVLRGE